MEIQGEVGLLSRTIQFHGERAFAQRDYGGHSMVMNGGVGIFKHVAAVRMGQLNTIARYPLHFHLLGNSEQSLVWGSSIVVSASPITPLH